MASPPLSSRLFRRHFAIPQEHGAWIWWIGPLAIGTAAGGRMTGAIFLLTLASLAVFLLRQPATIAVKSLSGRRAQRDLAPAIIWAAFYTLVAAACFAFLVSGGHERVLLLGIPGVAVFAWHLVLVSRREERGQMGVELVGAGVLALAAPAAYWVAGGSAPAEPWILWVITWLQSAASIVYIYLRLAQRRMERMPEVRDRWTMGGRTVAYHVFNSVVGIALAIGRLVPWAVPIAFGLMLADALEGVARPPVGARPSRIGLRQLGASTLFVVIVVLGYIS
jgi:hypothetical protein